MKTPVWFAMAIIFSACAHDLGLMKMEEQVNAYGAAIRWNQIKKAVGCLAVPPDRAPDWKRWKDIRVTAYRVVSRERSEAGGVLTQHVEISYLPPDSVVEKTVADVQRWRFDDDRNRWVLDSGLPHLD